MNIRAPLLAFLLLLLAGCEAAPPPRIDETDIAGPPIWQIAGESGEIEGWLFGTVHALPSGFAWRSNALDATLEDADILVVEVSSLAEEDALASLFTAMASDEPAPPLDTRVPADLDPAYRDLLSKAGIRSSQLDGLESWAAALTLAQYAQTANVGEGVDKALLEQFIGREIVELEGAEAQLSIFDNLPETEQRDLLAAVIRESTDYDRDFQQLAETWRAGDIDDLSDLAMRGILADPELYDALLKNRNLAWATQIENLLTSEKRPFVAVGAGHMIGADGLPAMLSASGYTITRVQ